MSNKSESSYERGQWAELVALDYLKKNGLELLEHNYHGPGGEIDLIMLEDNIIVFIEVRYRSNNKYVAAIESIDQKKCERIIKTSQRYLQKSRQALHSLCRLDVVTISGSSENPDIGWIKNAFQA